MQDNRNNEIRCHYYGPITPAGRPSIGGYEAANRKNIDALRRSGVTVWEHPNPRKPKIPLGALVYLKLLLNPFSMIRSAGKKDTVVHVTPLHRMLWYPSLFCVGLAKLLGLKTVVDLRAGAFIRFYETRGAIYRRAVRMMLAAANAVTVEGKPYVDYIKDITGGKTIPAYFPNTLDAANVTTPGTDPDRRFNLFYFGRISSSKGIGVMLEALANLDDRFRLYLAGNIASDIDPLTILSNDRVVYLGSLTPAQLEKKKQQMGFFIFPSTWSGEGQSNSLIEAMGAGLVAVASDNGFSRDVVADAGFVLPIESDGKDYAKVIAACASDGFEEMSSKSRRHILSHHNLDDEIMKLTGIYRNILNAQ